MVDPYDLAHDVAGRLRELFGSRLVATILVRQHGLDAESGRLLRSLFERRSWADYSIVATSVEEATQAVTDASAVVTAIRRWMATRGENLDG